MFTQTHARRLLKLASQMEKVENDKIALGTWCEKRSCGTFACVLGTAAMIPAFNKLGLRLYKPKMLSDYRVVYTPQTIKARNQAKRIFTRNYPDSKLPRRFTSFDAGECFFGLTESESANLFTASGYKSAIYRTPDGRIQWDGRKIAKVLREFVKTKIGAYAYNELTVKKVGA